MSKENGNIKEVMDIERENMLMSGLLRGMKQKNIEISDSRVSSLNLASSDKDDIVQAKFETENVLMDLYEVRDSLIESFSGNSINSRESTRAVSNINRIGACIRRMGGDVEEFVPLNHISGLNSPDSKMNMQRVIETTQSCYVLGKIANPIIKSNSIELTFAGKNGNVRYSARGVITAKDGWSGNEAIDYIYTPGEGRMSVKAFEKGTWTDKSGNFDVAWDLEEDVDDPIKNKTVEASNTIEKESVKKEKEKEKNTKNDMDDDIGDNDFGISGKK